MYTKKLVQIKLTFGNQMQFYFQVKRQIETDRKSSTESKNKKHLNKN